MSDVIETADAIHASASRLYWHSRDSVDQLAARLGMSRHALYASIRPMPAGVDCGCGGAMVFANRNQRALGKAHCPGCGAEQPVPTDASAHTDPPPEPLAAPRAATRIDVRQLWRGLSRVQPERAMLLGGAAAMGMAAAMVGSGVMRGLNRLW